jgi:hypothetical protein
MSAVIYVTNRGDTKLRDGYVGTFYDFPKDETVEIPLEAAKHIFGYMASDKVPHLTRLGWARSFAEIDKGFEKLAEFEISEQPPEKNRSLPSAVGVVALRIEKSPERKSTQRAA